MALFLRFTETRMMGIKVPSPVQDASRRCREVGLFLRIHSHDGFGGLTRRRRDGNGKVQHLQGLNGFVFSFFAIGSVPVEVLR
jgi:hypothetical protein